MKSKVKRMTVINNYFPMMSATAAAMNEEQLITDCIVPNIPKSWESRFNMFRGDQLNTIREVVDLLERVEAYTHDKEEQSRHTQKKENIRITTETEQTLKRTRTKQKSRK